MLDATSKQATIKNVNDIIRPILIERYNLKYDSSYQYTYNSNDKIRFCVRINNNGNGGINIGSKCGVHSDEISFHLLNISSKFDLKFEKKPKLINAFIINLYENKNPNICLYDVSPDIAVEMILSSIFNSIKNHSWLEMKNLESIYDFLIRNTSPAGWRFQNFIVLSHMLTPNIDKDQLNKICSEIVNINIYTFIEMVDEYFKSLSSIDVTPQISSSYD